MQRNMTIQTTVHSLVQATSAEILIPLSTLVKIHALHSIEPGAVPKQPH